MWLVGGFWGRLAPAGVVVGVSGVVLGLGSVVLGSLVLSGFGSCWLSRGASRGLIGPDHEGSADGVESGSGDHRGGCQSVRILVCLAWASAALED